MQNERLILGESPVWVKEKASWYCVDITSGTIHERSAFGSMLTHSNNKYVSNIVTTQNGFLITKENDVLLTCNNFKLKKLLCTIKQPISMRTNDGAVGPDGKYWFGTMEKEPSGLNGKLYSLDIKGTLLEQGACIGIPNSFIWLDEKHVLISDSYLQKTFKVSLLGNGTLDWNGREVWLDFSGTKGTPDGGALDQAGNVWLAVWGAAVINKYSAEGNLLETINLQALQPTSCAFGGANMDELLITTATDGMSDSQLKSYPDSGKLIRKKVDVKGSVLPIFKSDDIKC